MAVCTGLCGCTAAFCGITASFSTGEAFGTFHRFALLFWLALIASFVFTVMAVRSRGKTEADVSPAAKRSVGFIKKLDRGEENFDEK